ncbi:hypothetical protein FJZ36_09095 [Candidatus Poribacteria bacterium]|nr:hypothetical protein [Candidatus Poribacteria bacterium]
MRWKLLSLVLLVIVFLQCGGDTPMPNGNAETKGKSATVEIYEFKTAEELKAFRFPTDTKGTLGFRVTRIEKELVPIRSTPVFVSDGQHALDDSFINTDAIRIIVFR